MICLVSRLRSPTFRAFVNAISCSFWEKEEFLWCKHTLATLTVPTFHECTNTIRDRRSRAMARYAWHHVRAWYEIVWWLWWWWLHHMVLLYMNVHVLAAASVFFHFLFHSFCFSLNAALKYRTQCIRRSIESTDTSIWSSLTRFIHVNECYTYVSIFIRTYSVQTHSHHKMHHKKNAIRTKILFFTSSPNIHSIVVRPVVNWCRWRKETNE